MVGAYSVSRDADDAGWVLLSPEGMRLTKPLPGDEGRRIYESLAESWNWVRAAALAEKVTPNGA